MTTKVLSNTHLNTSLMMCDSNIKVSIVLKS